MKVCQKQRTLLLQAASVGIPSFSLIPERANLDFLDCSIKIDAFPRFPLRNRRLSFICLLCSGVSLMSFHSLSYLFSRSTLDGQKLDVRVVSLR